MNVHKYLPYPWLRHVTLQYGSRKVQSKGMGLVMPNPSLIIDNLAEQVSNPETRNSSVHVVP